MSHNENMPTRPAAMVLALLVAIAGCSSEGESATTSTQNGPLGTAPPQRVFQSNWQPASDPAARVAADEGLEQHGAMSLVPEHGGDETGSRASIDVFVAASGSVFSILHVTLDFPDGEVSISVTSGLSAKDAPTCEERINNTTGEGSPTWLPIVIRGRDGCAGTNDAGLTFLEWGESSYSFHVETFEPVNAARTRLGTWQLVP